MKQQERVVITGMGAISALGHSVAPIWDQVVQGKSAAKTITSFDTTKLSTKFAAQVQGFDPEACLGRKARALDPFVQYALVAAEEALTEAGLSDEQIEQIGRDRVGVSIGTGIGGLQKFTDNCQAYVEKGPRRVSPFFIPTVIPNMAAGHIAMRFNLQGANTCIATACTAGTHNLGYAAMSIREGHADIILAGGSEFTSNEMGFAGFCAARAMSKRNDAPEEASRPWDVDRDGFLLGDGAAVLVVESLSSAEARGATPLAEIVGFGMSADAHHITAPPEDGRGAYQSMRNALNNAGIQANDLSHINAHGTSTIVGDLAEGRAIQRLLEGDNNCAVTSTKSVTGHLLGAAGALEAMLCVKSLQENIIPLTQNLTNPEPELELDFVMGESRAASQAYVMSNSFGFGGTNASLVFKKC